MRPAEAFLFPAWSSLELDNSRAQQEGCGFPKGHGTSGGQRCPWEGPSGESADLQLPPCPVAGALAPGTWVCSPSTHTQTNLFHPSLMPPSRVLPQLRVPCSTSSLLPPSYLGSSSGTGPGPQQGVSMGMRLTGSLSPQTLAEPRR